MATDKIVAEYTVKVDEALKNLDKLAGKVDKIDAERKKSQAGFKDMSSSLASSFSKVGAAIGLAFGTAQIISFGKEAVKLAARAEGKQGIIESDTPFRKQIELTVEYATAVRNAAVEIKKDRESEIRALEQVNDKDAAIQKLKEDRIRLLKELETELANITSTETRKSENLKLLFAEKALENAVGLDVFQRGAAKERIKEANEEIKANVIKEGVLKSQISALIKILGLQKDGGEETNKSVVSIALLTSQLTDLKTESFLRQH
jgi:hypothetical protein